MSRVIGIRHRVKKTAEGEARPTQLCIVDGKVQRKLDLESETDELDFLLGHFPVKYRAVRADDTLSSFQPHHIKWRELKKDEEWIALEAHRREHGKKRFEAVKVPEAYDGLRAGDQVAMALGGSGSRLAFALSRRAEELGNGTAVFRVTPKDLKEWREKSGRDKNDDAETLAKMFQAGQCAFWPTNRRERDLIRLTEAYRSRIEAMKARIGCEQRLRQLIIGGIFCSEEGRYPEGSIEQAYDDRKANDAIMQALLAEESQRERELVKLVEESPVYQRIFTPIQGVGPLIAARLLVAIGDIRRFSTDAKLKAFLGVHVLASGKYADVPVEKSFPRQRGGMVANWHPDGRQALYLLADQFNRRPNSEWGQVLLRYKAHFRSQYPEALEQNGKKRYTDGHIHKMALWRTLTKFVERLFTKWWKLERELSGIAAAKAA